MALKDLPAAARPREKLLAQGAAALSDVELLALLLRTGYAGRDVFALAQQLLDALGGLAGLLHAEDASLRRTKGLGPAKRSELQAIAEVARRALAQQLRHRPVLDNPRQVREYLALHLAQREQEVFGALFLDAQLRLLGFQELFQGSLNQAAVYPREVAREALRRNAAAVIVAHNHPSGVAEPSAADEAVTQQLRSALQAVGVDLIDHLVVAQGACVSLRERGMWR